jgi:5-methylcytosine-specific restriction protein A
MPILYACTSPGCREVVPRGQSRCAQHGGGTATIRGYSSQWSTRAALFRQRYPLCGDRPAGQHPVRSECYDATPRRLTPAQCVDHVRPHGGDPGLLWDEVNNWQSLCYTCHARKTRAGL